MPGRKERPSRRRSGSPPKFVVDAMLGSLARKLRIFGFDASYPRVGSDRLLEALAKRGRRVLLTSDRELFVHARAGGVQAVLVQGRTDRERILSLQAKWPGVSFGMVKGRESRCAACNGQLQVVARSSLAGKVPAKVLARHRLFYRCPSCSRIYWRGGHWERLRRLSSSLKKGSSRVPRLKVTGGESGP